jgi:hypothetical protein
MSVRAKTIPSEIEQRLDALTALVDKLSQDNAAMRAELMMRREIVPMVQTSFSAIAEPRFVALKLADRGNFTYETARAWCAAGVFAAEKRGGRWFVN